MNKQLKNQMVFVGVIIAVAIGNGLLNVGVDMSQVGPFSTIAIPIAHTYWIQKQNIEDESRRE